jgi:hypothetical protein
MKYDQVIDGEWFGFPINYLFKHSCCDCGLCHDVEFKIKKDKLMMSWTVNNRATGQRRRYLRRTNGTIQKR